MVTRFGHRSARQRGVLMVELLAAILLLTTALLPLAYSVSSEKRLARAMYQRAIAMEIVDGEIEVLAAGGWRALTNGVSEYRVKAAAATNLPPGRFIVSVTPPKVRLEWRPEVKGHGGAVVREVTVK
jgi:hypothetical protein